MHSTTTPSANTPSLQTSRAARWTSFVMQGIAVLFLAADSIAKLVVDPELLQAESNLGFPNESIVPVGIIALVCLAIYLIPRTAILGAILWTGYLGGAIAIHFRVGNPLATHTLFPIYLAVLLWGALWLRDERLRALIPFRGRNGG